MTDVVSIGSNSATRGPGQRAGSWRTWTEPYERPVTRPAPTVDGKAVSAWAVHPPGQRRQALDQRVAVRPTVPDLGVLQGFPRDYPWRGGQMEQGGQVGNAVPPPLAAAVLAGIVKDRSSMTLADPEVIDLCAGPGGWDEGIRMLDPALHELVLGIEWDEAACKTREAAGHRTLMADIAAVDPLRWRGIRGLIASPPCTLFSQAGSGIGRAVLDLLADAIWRAMHDGIDCREDVRAAIYPTTRRALDDANTKRREAGKRAWTEEQIEKRAREDAYVAALVLEPARYIGALGDSLEWVAFEQVPAVLPLWQLYATALRKQGWSAWCGTLNAADYGVPQTRTRAILIARRNGTAHPPEATHCDGGSEADLFGSSLLPHVSMADALGWGMTAKPSTTLPSTSVDPVTGKGRGGPRALDGGSGAREMVRREYAAGRWTGRTLPWIEQPDDLADEMNNIPADVTPADVELIAGDSRGRGTVRRADEPAPTMHFGHAAGNVKWRVSGSSTSDEADDQDDVEPLPETAERWWVERVNDQTGTDFDLSWPEERPATTVATRGLVPHPGSNANRFNGSTKSRNDGLRITEQEAAVLQSFAPDYPWQGNRTKVFEQIGNAVPPQLSAHVVAAATGRVWTGSAPRLTPAR